MSILNEDFTSWPGNISPDGLWMKSDWFAVEHNDMDPSREVVANGLLNLTSTPGSNPLQGGEVQTTHGYGYGFYETSMKVSSANAGVASFFLYGAANGKPEFDIEFLLNDGPNQVHIANHPVAGEKIVPLSFDPTAAFHTYGINWIPGPVPGTATVQDFVDGTMVATQTSANFLLPPGGELIMMNAWSGVPGFGGGPPSTNATTQYDWVHFTPLSSVPPPSAGQIINGTGGNDTLTGSAGNDSINGFSGNDYINGAGGSDSLSGGRNHDTFVFKAGEANGDSILDFHDGGRSSDRLEFHGYGNGSFRQIDAIHWAIGYENNTHAADVITINGHVSLNDFYFLV